MDRQISYLHDALGQKLVAYMVGIEDPREIGRWSKEERAPAPERGKAVQPIFRTARLLADHGEANSVVRAWFMGMNPQLGERSPAEVIRDGDTAMAVRAALAFVAA
jgi:hypothetical protein